MAKNKIGPRFTKTLLVKFTDEQYKNIEAYTHFNDIENTSELIRHAVQSYIERDSSNNTLQLKAAKANKDILVEIRDMLDMIFRYVRLMHINLLAYHPEIEDPELKKAAASSANARHAKFFENFRASLMNDPAFFQRILHVFISEDKSE
jgi:hypothetical protein